ncbi:hypothetical protein MRX96_036843 [Rhipicephalus microplus]
MFTLTHHSLQARHLCLVTVGNQQCHSVPPLSAVPSVLCSPCVASQETQQAVSSPPSPKPPSRRELPVRTRRPPRRFMDYV